ncbi:MAG: molybdopterin converting factor subunit 1 [Candidatus Tectomicrobia bacterium]|nr:molybdopterin converting factor subunit 1 [Candidatus Tectomicrobia bacterium]
MKVKLLFFAMYRELVGEREKEVELSEGSTVRDLFKRMEEEYPKLHGIHDAVMIAVNTEYVTTETELKENDQVAFIPPVSGGTEHV